MIRIENFDILGVDWKIQLLRVVVSEKIIHDRGGLPKIKRGPEQFADLGGVVLLSVSWLRVYTLMHTM